MGPEASRCSVRSFFSRYGEVAAFPSWRALTLLHAAVSIPSNRLFGVGKARPLQTESIDDLSFL
jgi:hypothetical protein